MSLAVRLAHHQEVLNKTCAIMTALERHVVAQPDDRRKATDEVIHLSRAVPC